MGAWLLAWGPTPAWAATGIFQEATIRRIVEGRQVFVDRLEARVNQKASRGQQVSTGSSRAELLFDRRALAFLGRKSLIVLGQDCLRLQQGSILVNGRQNSCIGTRILGVRGTTYVLTHRSDQTYRLAVLHGETTLSSKSDSPTAVDAEPMTGGASDNILSSYPKLNVVADLSASAFGSNAGGKRIGEALGLVLADAGLFVPLAQSGGSKVVYNYTKASSNLDGYWGISSEFGYRWFDPNNRSLNGVLAGYDGWQSEGCFQSQVAVAGEWERNRWQFTALGGIPVDRCQNSIGYAIAGVGIPVAEIARRPLRVGLSPYMLHGLGTSFGGGRLSVSIPLGTHVDLTSYGQYDGLLNTTVGGQLRVRFPIGHGGDINDPNQSPLRPESPLPWQSKSPLAGTQLARIPQQATSSAIDSTFLQTSDAPGLIAATTPDTIIVKAGEQAIFDSEGNLISKSSLSQQDFEDVIIENMGGMPLLPESHAIGKLYERKFNRPIPNVIAVTGLDWYVGARTPMPRLRGSNNLEVPQDRLPQEEQSSSSSPPPPPPND